MEVVEELIAAGQQFKHRAIGLNHTLGDVF
jgi:hypothetical protein